MSNKTVWLLRYGGLTAVLVGYLSVWLPGPGAGLSFLGLELGEWIKFMGMGKNRNLFYLPPITLGLLLALETVDWRNDRWRTWGMRGLAVSVSLLSFPAIEAIRFEPSSEWQLRLVWIAAVMAAVLIAGALAWKRPAAVSSVWWPVLPAAIGLLGAVLPTWMYFQIRPLVSNAVGLPIGIGLGVVLNGLGHLLVALICLSKVPQRREAIRAG